MTALSAIATNTAAQAAPFDDEFGIGQKRVARIRLNIERACLQQAARHLLTTSYEPPEALSMWVRIYQADRADYDRALAVLGGEE